jgi:hypothetical protein
MNIPAFHRMKYPNRIAIKNVVINLKRICIPVKADKQSFVFDIHIAFKVTIVFNGVDSPSDIGLAYTVFES